MHVILSVGGCQGRAKLILLTTIDNIVMKLTLPCWLNLYEDMSAKVLYLGYRYIFFYMEETWKHVSVHWQQGKRQLWANCFMCQWRETGTSESQRHIFVTHRCVQRANHSGMTHPWKTDWHQPNDPTHRTQQWGDQDGEVHHESNTGPYLLPF